MRHLPESDGHLHCLQYLLSARGALHLPDGGRGQQRIACLRRAPSVRANRSRDLGGRQDSVSWVAFMAMPSSQESGYISSVNGSGQS
jgi:hypothetical protein